MVYQGEAQLEELLIEQLVSQDYKKVVINNNEDLVENFKIQFSSFNSDKLSIPLTDKEWERVFNHVLGKSIHQGAKILRDKFVLTREDGTEVYLSFLSEDSVRNIYQVTHQTTVVGKYANRYDVTIVINGLPLVQIELKRRGIDIKQAFNQIERYRKHSYNGLYRYIQMFVVSNGVDTKYYANSDKELLYSFAFFWTDAENRRITNLHDFTLAFLEKFHLTKMLCRYTIINDTDKLLMIMRPYQVYATEALIRQATNTTRNAYVWHTTGAGKTLTSFKTAQILAANPNIKKVLFLVDRKDLDTQTTEEFNKFEAGSVDATNRTDVLVKQIKDKNRQLIITTIQKMAKAIANPRYEEVMKLYKDEKVIFIVDECHRTQFGEMNKAIKQHFSKAQYFGFTGTPRFVENKSQDGRTTADIFEECVHSYLIKEAIFDNNVLGFHVEYIKTFSGQYDEDDPTLVEGIDTEEIYMADERISLIANHIVQNHKYKTRNKQYTAVFATSSIPALIKYYDGFKGIHHDLNIAAVFSYGANEDAEGRDEHSRDALERIIKDYNETFRTNFSTETFQAYNKDISDRVKGKKTQPLDILIVVNMYLTGFDSKPLNTLYVDKKLKYHDLIQAYSRTNRVEKATKPIGNIICYRNLKKRTDEALKLFSKTDNVDGILLKDFDFYLEKFNELVEELRGIAPTPQSIDSMQSEEDQKKFIIAFRELSKVMLVLRTFVEFSFDRDKLSMTEQEFEDYRSKYQLIYERHKQDKEKVSVLDDIDFAIELMESNRINVAYIMNLIREIDFENEEKKKRDIKHIKDELERADNPELRKKVDLLRNFLDQVAIVLTKDDDVDLAYDEYENKVRNEEIQSFAENEEVSLDFIKNLVSEYEFTGIINKTDIRESIEKPMTLLKKVSLATKIMDFIKAHVERFQ